MKKLKLIGFLLLLLGLSSWTPLDKGFIAACFINFDGAKNLSAQAHAQLPKSAAMPRKVKTADGMKSVSRIDGFRVLYHNEKDLAFVNLKIEQSAEGMYQEDQEILLENLRYSIKNSGEMKSEDIIELDIAGQKVYGLSRNAIGISKILSTFIMFPGNDIVVYFYFNNMKPEFRNFKSLKDFEKQRDAFIERYIRHIKDCA